MYTINHAFSAALKLNTPSSLSIATSSTALLCTDTVTLIKSKLADCHQCCYVQDAENNWQFDIFGFAEATKGSTLSLLFYHFMKQMGIIQEFHLDEHKLCKYVQKIESGYDSSNPYHNR